MSLGKKLIYLLLKAFAVEHEITLAELSLEAEQVYHGIDNETVTDHFVHVSSYDKLERLKRIVELIVVPYQTPLETEEAIRHLKHMLDVVQEGLGEEKDEATSIYVAAKSVLGGTDV